MFVNEWNKVTYLLLVTLIPYTYIVLYFHFRFAIPITGVDNPAPIWLQPNYIRDVFIG